MSYYAHTADGLDGKPAGVDQWQSLKDHLRGVAVLVNVCYRLYAQAEFAGHHDGTTWPPHAYHDVFNRALERGQWFYTPCLGWKEFAPNYVGPFRPETRVCETENHDLPTMLRMVFDQMQNGKVKPSFFNKRNHPDLRVEKGVLVYA